MTKRKKVTLLCMATVLVACLGVAFPLLMTGEDSSQSESSNTDASSAEVSVSISGSCSASEEGSGESGKESTSDKETSGKDSQTSNEETSSESVQPSSESEAYSDSISQTSDSMSATNDSSSTETSSPIELTGLGAHGLSVPYSQGKTEATYFFTVPEDGVYAISSQSVTAGEERFALTYTVNGFTDYVTDEKQLLDLKQGDVLLLTAYAYDDSLFVQGSFSIDFSITRQLHVGENTLSVIDERVVVYFIPTTDGEYLFTASANAKIFYYSALTYRNEELTTALSLTAGVEISLIVQMESEEEERVKITVECN